MKYQRLHGKLLYSAILLVVYILGKNIPIPWVGVAVDDAVSDGAVSSLMQFIIGNSRDQISVFALGLTPWMTASIIIQLSTLSQRGAGSRGSSAAIQKTIRYLALVFAAAYAWVRSATMDLVPFYGDSLALSRLAVILTMMAGSFAVLWLGEQNCLRGIGGLTLIILIDIIRNFTRIFSSAVSDIRTAEEGAGSPAAFLLIILIAVAGIMVMILFENSEIRLPVQRVMIDSEMEGDNYIAIKLNPAGTQPMMYVMAFYLVPYYLFYVLAMLFPESARIGFLSENMTINHPFGAVVYLAMFIFITISLAYVQINPSDLSEQMRQRGDCIVGLAPGRDTERCLNRIVRRHGILSAVVQSFFIGIPMVLCIVWSSESNLFMLPMLLMIIAGIMQNISIEIRVIHRLDHYNPVL
ncbi:MAG: accessory Sec system protein translocase subunit SecY2 [Clostridiales bacterium]|nr:accessory Sec system protein translocase subunit SecY2 [Clostridiales bacterium]